MTPEESEELYDDVTQFGAPPAMPSRPLPPTTPPGQKLNQNSVIGPNSLWKSNLCKVEK